MVTKMTTGLAVGIGVGPFATKQPEGSSNALDVITSSNGAWWVVKERDGSNNLVDQTGGGRNLTLPGGSANPVLLDHDNAGTDYFWFPGTAENYLSVPDSAALSVTGDIDISVRVRLDDYSPAADQGLVAKLVSSGNFSYSLRLSTTGDLRFLWSENGTVQLNKRSLTAVAATNGTDAWFRVTLDVDNGAGDAEVKFYEGGSGTTPSWSQLGSTALVGATTSIYDSTSYVAVGAQDNNSNNSKGRIYRAIIKDGIDGTTVLDVNASDADPNSTTFTEASSNAATVTINRSSTGYCTEVVDQPGYAFATDDYLYATDDALFDVGASDEFTAGLVVRVHGTPGSDYALITKKNTTSGTDAGWSLQENTAGKLDARVADGTASPDKVTASAVTDHVLIAASIVRDATTVGAYDPSTGSIETASDTTTGTLANAQQLRIGADGGGADFLRGFVVGAFYLKDTARTAAQIDGLSDALITANGGTP